MKKLIGLLLSLLLCAGCGLVSGSPGQEADGTGPADAGKSPAQTWLEAHSEEEILALFEKAAYITGGFAGVEDIHANELFRFAVLVSEQGGGEWFDDSARRYVIPVSDIRNLLNGWLEDCVFSPAEMDRYVEYRAEENLLLAEAVGFGTGSSRFSLVSAQASEEDALTVRLLEEDSREQVTVTAAVSEDGVRFVSCLGTRLWSGNVLP